MYMSIAERKKIQAILEDTIGTLEYGEKKNLFLLMLSMVYELNEKDGLPPATPKSNECHQGGVCFRQLIQSLMETFAALDLRTPVDAEYLEYFTSLADNLTRLSVKVNELRSILVRLQARGDQPKTPAACILQ